MRHRMESLVIIALLGLWVGAGLAAAGEPLDRPQRVRVGIAMSGSDGDEGDGFDDVGYGAAWEWRFAPYFGLGLSAYRTEVGLGHGWGRERARMTPVAAGALFHLTPERAVDFYLGPGLAVVTFSGEGARDYEDKVVPAFEIGFDVLPRRSPVGFHLDLKHLMTAAGDRPPDHDVVTVAMGVVFRF